MLGTGVGVIARIREEEEQEEEEEVFVWIIQAASRGGGGAAVGSHSSCGDGSLIGRPVLLVAVGSNGP